MWGVVVFEAEPTSVVLTFDGTEVGRMEIGPGGPEVETNGEHVEVTLRESRQVKCVVLGGNPAPNITLTSGRHDQHAGFNVVKTTERDATEPHSEPVHQGEAVLEWTPKVDDIGRPFVCSAGVDQPRAVWTSFVPTVIDSEQYSTPGMLRPRGQPGLEAKIFGLGLGLVASGLGQRRSQEFDLGGYKLHDIEFVLGQRDKTTT